MLPPISFEEIGIDEDVGQSVVQAIGEFAAQHPSSSIRIDSISALIDIPANVVKQIFYTLLAYRLLKATFIPRHRICGNVIGPQEKSVQAIFDRVTEGNLICIHCGESVDNLDDVQIQLIFWMPGTHG
jgi:hypothetical protein